MWDALRLDVRHSLRSLRRAPTFSLIVIVTLALAVGATTAVGSLLNALVFRQLAVPSPERLVALSALEPRANMDGYFYADTFKAYRDVQRSFAQMSMYSGGGSLRVEARSEVFEDARTEAVSPSYFDIVGARPSAGRFFGESDEAVAVISEDFRRRIFGGAPGLGEAIKVNGAPATVIGVVDGFDGLQFDGTVDIIVPFAVMRSAGGDPSRPFRSKDVVGRLATGVSIEGARAELLARWPSIQSATLPATLPDAEREGLLRQRLNVAPLASGYSGLRSRYGATLWVLLALVGILLAVACANLAGLTLARSLIRRHEVAIRLALGGSQRRVFCQLLVDGILLSTVALAGALPLAWGIVRVVTASLVSPRGPVVLAALGGWWLVRVGLRPAGLLAAQAEHASESQRVRLDVPDPNDEFGRLATSFNGLLERLDRARDAERQLMADASHELRTPVSIARTAAEVTLSQPSRTEHEYRESLGIIAEQARRLAQMVDGMFVLARADAGGQTMVVDEFYLDELAHECVRGVSVVARTRQVEVSCAATEDLQFRGDEGLVRRLMVNLLQNAVEHAPSNGHVSLAVEGRDGTTVIRVTDNGPGIPVADRERVFGRFVRLPGVNRAPGAGLGLPIARWIAEAHGGRLNLVTADPGCTVFEAALPSNGTGIQQPAAPA